MKRMKKIIEMCGLEDDVNTWEDVGSKLFNGIEYAGLCNWHSNRDRAIADLIGGKKRDSEAHDSTKNIDYYFDRGNDGRLIAKMPLYIERFHDDFSGVTIFSDGVYLGENVELMDSVIRTVAYIGKDARVINSRIQSTKNKKGEASYIGVGANIEDAHQFCKSVVGSGVDDFKKYPKTYIHAAINGAIVGGSTGISDGTGFQGHWVDGENTRLVDPFDKNNIIEIPFNEKSRTPTIIGSNCRIGGGVQIVSPLIVASGQDVGSIKLGPRGVLSGMVVDGRCYSAERVGLEYKVYSDLV